MNKRHLWTILTPKQATESLNKYGHLLKWKNCKAHVMDLGCGEGNVTSKILYPYVKDRIGKLTAIDISPDLIDYARKEYKVPDIDFEVMDALDVEQIEKKKGKFDHIFSFYVAQWISDQRAFTNGLWKMLKPGGQIYMAHISRAPLHYSFRKQFKEGRWSKYLPEGTGLLHYTEDPTGYIRKIVEEVGFRVEVCDNQIIKISLENCPDFIRALASLHPYLDRIPPELLEDYYQDHLKNSLEKCTYLGEPNVYSWSHEILTCIASK